MANTGTQQKLWIVEVTDDEDNTVAGTTVYHDEDVARDAANRLRAAYAALKQAKRDLGCIIGGYDYTVEVQEMTVEQSAPVIAVIYRGIVQAAHVTTRRDGTPVHLVPGMFAEVVEVSDETALAALPGGTGVRAEGSDEIGYNVYGPDPVAVRAEQARLWAHLNPDLPPIQ